MPSGTEWMAYRHSSFSVLISLFHTHTHTTHTCVLYTYSLSRGIYIYIGDYESEVSRLIHMHCTDCLHDHIKVDVLVRVLALSLGL